MSLVVRRKVKKDAAMTMVCQFHCKAKLIQISEEIHKMESRKQSVGLDQRKKQEKY